MLADDSRVQDVELLERHDDVDARAAGEGAHRFDEDVRRHLAGHGQQVVDAVERPLLGANRVAHDQDDASATCAALTEKIAALEIGRQADDGAHRCLPNRSDAVTGHYNQSPAKKRTRSGPAEAGHYVLRAYLCDLTSRASICT